MRLDIVLFSYGEARAQTLDAMLEELEYARERKIKVNYHRVHDDALISRSRSKALSDFLSGWDGKTKKFRPESERGEVTVQVDHDVEWTPGEIVDLATRALEKQACVGGFYSTRAKGLGIAGRLKDERVQLFIGEDKFFEAEYLPGGFTAFPRVVAQEVLDFGKVMARLLDEPGVEIGRLVPGYERRIIDGALHECIYWDWTKFYPFFSCIQIPSAMQPGSWEALSEDWSFSHRARLANPDRKQWLRAKPVLAHWGSHPFLVADAGQKAPGRLVR